MKFPLIEQLGLEVIEAFTLSHVLVRARDLETLLEKAQRVYLEIDSEGDWNHCNAEFHNVETHTALLLNIQPIEKKCEHERKEFKSLDFVRCCDCGGHFRYVLQEIEIMEEKGG